MRDSLSVSSDSVMRFGAEVNIFGIETGKHSFDFCQAVARIPMLNYHLLSSTSRFALAQDDRITSGWPLGSILGACSE